jgi:hypothetical protein
MITGAHAEAMAAADRASALAEMLGLPEPARALGYRGFARAYCGDPDGLAEMERAHTLLVEAGAGHAAAILLNNLAIAQYPVMGPARSLATFEEGIAFCEQRGLIEAKRTLEANCPGLLVELGRPEEAVERAGRLAPGFESRGDTYDLIEVRAAELVARVARGEQKPRAEVDWIISSAQTLGATDVAVYALAGAAAALAECAPERAHNLIAALERLPGARENPYYARQLTTTIRTALAADDRALASRLVEGMDQLYPLREHAVVSARAQLAEHAGEHAEAATLYAEAAARWREFGNVPETAYSLLGEGRCLLALARGEAQRALSEAREVFAAIGYAPALRDTASLLGQAAAAAP